MNSIPARKLKSLKLVENWLNYEVLTNPDNLNLYWAKVDLRQKKKPTIDDRLMPPRPVLAERPTDANVPPPFVARAAYDNEMYIGVAQETSNNGTNAFYYGLLNVLDLNEIRVLNIMNTHKPGDGDDSSNDSDDNGRWG